jgi:FlgD Ig-like domain
MRAAFHCGAILFTLASAACHREVTDGTIHFKLAEDAHVSVLIENAAGEPVRQIAVDEPRSKGRQAIFWDGKDGGGRPAPSGRYRWRGVSSRGLGVRLRGWACAGGDLPWEDERKGFREIGGAAAAVTADDERVYLGWTSGRISACDSSQRAVWSARLPDGASCESLAADGGLVYALARSRSGDFTSDEITRFDARLGKPVPWPKSESIPVPSLWPADAAVKPAQADGFCVRSGRIYLTFTSQQFLAVLDATTGVYLQTVVGGAPTLIDATPTKTESPDRPGELMDVDFAVVALRGGVLGKVLFAHDPLWVVTSDLQSLDSEERITALALLGDAAKHHRHSVFVGLDAPFQQVQRRSVLDTEGFQWTAGRSGGRPATGPWQPDSLGSIRAVALDGEGRLWVAEGDAVPPRFSVWNTEGSEGHLLREVFGPRPQPQSGAAVLPSDPDVFVGAGCEWRLDPKTGESRCLGVITREPMVTAEFVTLANGKIELHVAAPSGAVRVFERRGEGDYVLLSESHARDTGFEMQWQTHTGTYRIPVPGQAKIASGKLGFADCGVCWRVTLNETTVLGDLFDAELPANFPASATVGTDVSRMPRPHFGSISQSADGRVFAGATSNGLMNLEITGLDTVRPLPGGEIVLAPPAR